MLPTAHFASAVILSHLLQLGTQETAVLVGTSVLIDVDFLFSRMHRELPTHSPLVLLALLPFSGSETVLLVILGVALHFLLDSLDFGVMLRYPFESNLRGLRLVPHPEIKTSINYWRNYLKSKEMLALETGLMLGAAVSAGCANP